MVGIYCWEFVLYSWLRFGSMIWFCFLGLVILSCEHFHWVQNNPFIAIRKLAVAIEQCERALKSKSFNGNSCLFLSSSHRWMQHPSCWDVIRSQMNHRRIRNTEVSQLGGIHCIDSNFVILRSHLDTSASPSCGRTSPDLYAPSRVPKSIQCVWLCFSYTSHIANTASRRSSRLSSVR